MSGLFGGGGSDPNKAARKSQEAQMARLDALELPELEQYILENPELVGLLEAEGIDPSAMEGIQEDQALRDNQMKALEGLSQRAEEGITSEDKYAMEQMLGGVAGQEKAAQANIEQDMARRGMDSSGAALMAKLQTKQSGANVARDKAMQMAAQAQQNKMAALSQLGAQSGQMSAQDFNRQSQVASAKDAISRANAMNRQHVSGQNLAARQGIENQRANIANMNKQVGNQIAQQDFQNRYSKTGAQGSVANSMSQIDANAAQKPGGLQSALGGAATGASIGNSVVPGGAGAGYGAAIGAGVGLLGGMEDGGIAGSYEDGGQISARERDTIAQQNKDSQVKQRDAFKKKYMKQIHDEVLASTEEVTGNIPKAEDGALMGYDFSKGSLEDNIAQGKGVSLGRDNDLTSADIQTNEQAQVAMNPESEMNGADVVKGIGVLSKLLGDGKKKRANLDLGAYSQPELKNSLGALKVPQFEDGGSYASDGMGGIIDSGEDSFAGDRIDAKVNDGEIVINLPQQQRLMDLLRGEIGVDEIGSDDIIEGVPREDRDEMHEECEQDSKMNALMKIMGDM